MNGMCGRFALAFIKGFFTRFEVIDQSAQIQPRFNIAPSQRVPIIVSESPNKVVEMKWGLVPFWAKDPKIGNRLINARGEGISKKPAYRASVKRRRCLVPATGFYEWREEEGRKTPYYVHMKDGGLFAFAGLWDSWNKAEGEPLQTFTIITTRANSALHEIHNRMPVILRREHESLWLEQRELEPDELARIFKPYPAKLVTSYEVSTDVNNARNEGEHLIEPVVHTQSGVMRDLSSDLPAGQ